MTFLFLSASAALAIFLIVTYNQLTRLRQLARNAYADIDVQLKRRHELVPSLVAAVRGHAGYESGTLVSVVDARTRAVTARGPAATGVAEHALSGEVRQLLAIAEAYPDLRAAESFLSLQKSLVEIEDHIQNARRYYNAVVRDYNTKLEQIPSNVVAGPMGFEREEFFGLSEAAERASPQVKL
ncbi:MAG TPA: LemA family protein [Gemmatimonadaceae bacterium]|nr:LemA family protein [Gemmatimonadaceae bacterium]